MQRIRSRLRSSASLLAPAGFAPATLNLDFCGLNQTLDSRITFTRGSTATFTGSDGLIQSAAINTPRFDYNPVTLVAKGLLIEEQRTNLLLRSEEFDTASWPKNNGTVTANMIASPDGTTNADAFIENTAVSAFHSISQTQSKAASNIQYTGSFYVKDKGRQVPFNIQSSGTNGVAGRVNPATGAVVQNAAAFGTGWTAGTITMTAVGNGWYRVVMTATSDTLTSVQFSISLHNGTTNVYTGDGVSGAYLYGAQLETGAFATSYIPTAAATVTRSADVATMSSTNFSSWYNQSAGTIFASILSAPVNTIAQQALYLSDGTASNTIFTRRNSSGSVATAVSSGGVTQGDVSAGSAVVGGAAYKYAFAYAVNNLAESVNGSAVGADTSATIPTLSQMNLGASVAGIQYLNGHLRAITYYPQRLPNATLQALTA